MQKRRYLEETDYSWVETDIVRVKSQGQEPCTMVQASA